MGWRVTRRLPAVSLEGVRYTVIQMENGREIDFVMDSGLAVSRTQDGRYRIDETGEILRIVGT